MSTVGVARAVAGWQEQGVKSNNARNNIFVVNDEIEGHLLQIPEAKMPPDLAFRHGCHVVCFDFEVGMPPIVLYGIVEYAALNLNTKDYMYCIHSKPYGEPYFAKAKTLHFAQGTPVWAKLPGIPGYSEALVFSSQQAPDAPPTYSVTQTTVQGFHTNIPEKHVKYRGPGTVKPVFTEPPNSVETKTTPIETNSTELTVKQEDGCSVLAWNPFNSCGVFSVDPVPPPQAVDQGGPAQVALEQKSDGSSDAAAREEDFYSGDN